MAGEIAIPETGIARGRTLDELRPHEGDLPAYTPEEARELTELVRQVSVRVNDIVVNMYIGRAHLALGYETWAQFCQEEDLRLEFRPTIEQRRELHYFMYWLHGMPGRAVAAFTRSDQKTVAADAEAIYRERLALDAATPERPGVITDTRGRSRTVPTKPAEEVIVEASVSDLPAQQEEAGDDEDIIDVEEVPASASEALVEPVAMPPIPEQSRGREPDWPELFEHATRHMRAAIEKARFVMTHPRMQANLHNQPEGRLREWAQWASDMVDWADILDTAEQD